MQRSKNLSQILGYFKNKYVIFVSLLRLSGYIYMLYNPFEGILISFLFDMLDWVILSYGKLPKSSYYIIDKVLDIPQYFFLIPILYKTEIFPVFIFFFAYRMIGQVLVMLFKNRKIYLLFPNFIEYFALIFFFNQKFNFNLNISSATVIIPLVLLKLFQEYWIHIKPKSYSWFLGRYIREKISGLK